MRLLIIIMCCGAAIFAILGVLVFFLLDPYNLRAPRDEVLIAAFYAHRPQFERLAVILLTHPSPTGIACQNCPEPTKANCMTLLSAIDSHFDVGVDYNAVRFTFTIGGLSAIGVGWSKGLEYVPGSPDRRGKMVRNLDAGNRLAPGIYLRQIAPRWFIVYQRTDD